MGRMEEVSSDPAAVIYVIPVLRPVPLFCAETLARIAAQRK